MPQASLGALRSTSSKRQTRREQAARQAPERSAAMLRRAVALVACSLLGLGLAHGPARAADPPARASKAGKANFEIKAGMTVEQVEAVLGPGKPITAEQFGEP